MNKLKVLLLVTVILLPFKTFSQNWFCPVRNDVGKIALGRGNDPFIGGSNSFQYPIVDCLTGSGLPVGSCRYPKDLLVTYLSYCDGWVGGIIKGDTLVSSQISWPYYLLGLNGQPFEFYPHEYPFSQMTHRSTLDPTSPEYEGAISEQDFISTTADTFTYGLDIIPDYFQFRPHKPLGIEVENKSYAWSIGYAEDFVLFEWLIRNIGKETINDAYVGIELNAAIGDLYVADPMQEVSFHDEDELGGFLSRVNSPDGCGFKDTVFIMWSADNDGDPVQGNFVSRPTIDVSSRELVASCRNVSAIELISAPVNLSAGNTVSYNWWDGNFFPDYNFGPRHKENYRNFHTGGLGSPWGDVNQYYTMQNNEIDYDPAYTAQIRPYDLTWMYPDQSAAVDIANGTYLTQLLSVGPFDIQPGGEVPIVFAFVMGENFHTNPHNAANLPFDPGKYYANVDFSDLIQNAQWARFIYDNPGVDTDGDGYAGEFRVCEYDSVINADSNWIVSVAETTYYKGDGVPDWKVAQPPPTPKVWVTPMYRGIHIRFNGQSSENSKDVFTRLNDFEGFNIYIARDEREQSYSLVASYDIENYDKYFWNEDKQPDPGWELREFPSTLEEIRCKYALGCDDSIFDPLRFRPGQPYQLPNFPESLFYWEKHLWNVSEFGITSDIKKLYPNVRDPRLVPANSLIPDDYTDDGYLKFFDYEFTIQNLLPTVGYFVSVTALDFGWPAAHIDPLESSITDNAQQVYASVIDSVFNGTNKQIVVYPNPYRNDQNYRSRGFEGLGQGDRTGERLRRIHFANLPPKCVISIFSLDGDLVREIHHDVDANDPTSSHVEWGLISRNGLAVVSGLYYWVVEFPNGETQMGKLAIIL